MPITKDNCESFYQGTFAEHQVSSLFYLFGYEAHKVSPDVGIDFLVTNLAGVQFRNEQPVKVEVQVKSVLHDQTGAYAKMSEEELDFLCVGEQRYCVFAVLHDLQGSSDPQSFERGDDPDASNAVDRMILGHIEMETAERGRERRRNGSFSLHDFTSANVMLFWLHSSHMRRLRDDGGWKRHSDGSYGMDVQLTEGLVCIGTSGRNGGSVLIPELLDPSFIVRRFAAKYQVHHGNMSMDDY